MCDCIAEIDGMLANSGARLSFTTFSKPPKRPMIRTETIDRCGKRPPLILANHCPWCGEKYSLAAVDTTATNAAT